MDDYGNRVTIRPYFDKYFNAFFVVANCIIVEKTNCRKNAESASKKLAEEMTENGKTVELLPFIYV